MAKSKKSYKASKEYNQIISDLTTSSNEHDVQSWPPGSSVTNIALPSKVFIELAKLAQPKPIPINSIVESVDISGTAEDKQAKFNLDMTINVVNNQWSITPLLPKGIAVLISNIEKISEEKSEEDDEEEVVGLLGVYNNQHSLLSHGKAKYKISLEFSSDFLTQRKESVKFPFLIKSLKTTLDFTVQSKSIRFNSKDIYAVQWYCICNSRDLSSRVYLLWKRRLVIIGRVTNIGRKGIICKDCTREGEETIEEKMEIIPEEVIVSSEQNTLVSIGEGHITTTTILKYTISNGTRSVFLVDIIDNQLKIASVEVSGVRMKKWEIIKSAEEENSDSEIDPDDPESELNKTENRRTLRVILERTVEKSCTVVIIGEVKFEQTSFQTKIPTFVSHGEGLIKETGYVGITPITNIEMTEIKSDITRVDPSEVDDVLNRYSSGKPMVLCYKFLRSNFNLEIDVKKHKDSAVLVCVADQAVYTITQANEKLLHHCIFNVRATAKQFLRVKLPKSKSKDIEIWSASVAGITCKPAVDKDGFVLIPIQSASSEENSSFEMIKSIFAGLFGSSEINVACLDVPINRLIIRLYIPKEIHPKISGDFETIKKFIYSPPVTSTKSYNKPMRAQAMSLSSNIMDFGGEFEIDTIGGSSAIGSLPVKIKPLQEGTLYTMHRLLVTPLQECKVNISYNTLSRKKFYYLLLTIIIITIMYYLFVQHENNVTTN